AVGEQGTDEVEPDRDLLHVRHARHEHGGPGERELAGIHAELPGPVQAPAVDLTLVGKGAGVGAPGPDLHHAAQVGDDGGRTPTDQRTIAELTGVVVAPTGDRAVAEKGAEVV